MAVLASHLLLEKDLTRRIVCSWFSRARAFMNFCCSLVSFFLNILNSYYLPYFNFCSKAVYFFSYLSSNNFCSFSHRLNKDCFLSFRICFALLFTFDELWVFIVNSLRIREHLKGISSTYFALWKFESFSKILSACNDRL